MDAKKRIRRRKLAQQLIWPIQEVMDNQSLTPQDVLEVMKDIMGFIHGDSPKLVTDAWILTQMRRAGY